MKSLSYHVISTSIAIALMAGSHGAQAQRVNASDASALSLLPVAVLVAAPTMILSGGVMLTVVAVEALAKGSVWIVERVSDGTRASLQLASGASAVVGTGVLVTAMSAGWLLSATGQVIAFVPNEIGASLLYNERVTR